MINVNACVYFYKWSLNTVSIHNESQPHNPILLINNYFNLVQCSHNT